MLIPKVTHQVWFQGWENLPKKFHENVKKLRKLNPDWTHKTWDENQLRVECNKYSAECGKKFDEYEYLIQKVDFGRYVILYLYGGITIDCDMESIAPLMKIPELDFSPMIVSKANDSKIETGLVTFGHIMNDSWFINNGFIATKPRNEDIKKLIESCINDHTEYKDYFSLEYFISTTTGPIRISSILKKSNMTILYSDVLESEYKNDKSIFIHKHELSWTNSLSALIVKTYLYTKEHKKKFILLFTLLIFLISRLILILKVSI